MASARPSLAAYLLHPFHRLTQVLDHLRSRSQELGILRTYLQSRLAYRIQELAYGGLKPETVARLEALGEQLDGGNVDRSAASAPTTGRSPARGWSANTRASSTSSPCCADGFEYRGPALPVALRHRPRHHRHALERLGRSSA